MTLFADNEWWRAGAMGYMIDGGPFMWPILLLAVIGAGVIVERFRALRLIAIDAAALRGQVLDLLRADKVEEAVALCARAHGPVPAILAVGIHRYKLLRKLNYDPGKIEEQVVKAMEDYSAHISAALEKNLSILSTVATVAPMLGSLGTVVGMVLMFEGIATMGRDQDIIKVAAAGIKVKLIVTVWGLMVGIPAYMFFNYFSSVVGAHILEAEETASELIEALILHLAPGSGDTPGALPALPAPAQGGT
ncbi:MAG: MotA/TolQ/ExbB proton channel family protein [Planctomycetes bacterium]|nr:MotA/TolQ/ExbB proton channel family protein [Planctomycetota bacterium]